MKNSNEKRFLSKGENVVQANNKVVDMALSVLKEIDVDKKWKNLVYFEDEQLSDEEVIRHLKGDTLPVSAFIDKANGVFEGGNTWREKRDIAERVPCWKSESCIQCNQCAFVCPHGVIRPFLLDKNDNEVDSVDSLFPRDVKYTIGVSYKDCTGCGLCYQTCPGKLGNKAIEMVPYDRDKFSQDDFDYLVENNINGSFKKNILNVKNTGFIAPKFEFSGSCAGCGETAYLKNLTQVFQERLMVANATGCSSIWANSSPSTPYTTNKKGHGPAWSNSLFEDAAEFGYGMLLAQRAIRDRLKNELDEIAANTDKADVKDAIKEWNDTFASGIENGPATEKLVAALEACGCDASKNVLKEKDFLAKKSQWIFGGDGWAYDIGFGGVDHVLASGKDINVMVFDTEVYSNTGGQSSKSTPTGAIAQFAAGGKETKKKDLAGIAMSYGYVYVAHISMGADMNQCVKALAEAEAYPGPSLIIAYAPCINHGIKKGMSKAQTEEKLAVESGYWFNFRYNPTLAAEGKDAFSLDSKEPTGDYQAFLKGENRYASLAKFNPERAAELFAKAEKNSKDEYDHLKKLVTLYAGK